MLVKTDQLLIKYYENPIKLCEKLLKYFPHTTSADKLHRYLSTFGMYRYPITTGEDLVKKLKDKRLWETMHKQIHRLQKLWKGPHIPVFILPSDQTNRRMNRMLNGKSGVAFHNKLFLFINTDHSLKEIFALLIHEYHHVCRLAAYKKMKERPVLLDTIILEGMAEQAVYKQLGKDYLAPWTSYYSQDELGHMWERLILPQYDLPKNHPKHDRILYGGGFIPEMAGYCVGYYLVNKYLKKTKLDGQTILATPAKDIAQI